MAALRRKFHNPQSNSKLDFMTLAPLKLAAEINVNHFWPKTLNTFT